MNFHPCTLDHLVIDLRENLKPIAFLITTENFVEFEEKRQKLSCAQCIEPYVFIVVIIINVHLVYYVQ